MVYSCPPDSPTASPRPRNHRRSHSSNTFFSDEKGPGAFVSLGALPKLSRKPSHKKSPTFHFRNDDEDDDDSTEDDPIHSRFSALSIDTQNLSNSNDRSSPTLKVHPPTPGDDSTVNGTVPFPRCSPMSPVSENTPPLTASSPVRRPPLSRGASHPILLSNGKPLKSSLKSSSSSGSIPIDNGAHSSLHLRVQSAPSTPFLSKNVHFPKEDGLESVRVFNRKARPASLSLGGAGDDTETETELENSRFPFPKFGSVSSGPLPTNTIFEIDYETPGATSQIPATNRPANSNHIHFEALSISHQPSSSPLAPSSPHLSGTILVRNVAYEKSVAVRFTLDDWQTTSEVRAKYVSSVVALPWESKQGRTLGDAVSIIANAGSATWDRFTFTIRLEDHAYKLHERVLWLVGRYTCTGEGCGEWWDNNAGMNYRVGFKVASSTPAPAVGQIGREDTGRTVSAADPVMKPVAAVEPAARQTFGLGFEFPTLMSAPKPAPPAASYTSPPASPPARRVPPPSSPRLNLLNYAAPAPRASRSPLNSPLTSTTNSPNINFSASLVTPPESPKDEYGHSSSPRTSTDSSITPRASVAAPQMMIGGHPATTSFTDSQMQGLALHWPWGFGTSNTSSRDLISPLGTPPGSGSNSPRRFSSSPRTMSPLSSSSPSPQSRSGSASPTKLGLESVIAADSEQLYNEFVKQWCFAQSPGPGPGQGMNGFPGVDLADGVLVV